MCAASRLGRTRKIFITPEKQAAASTAHFGARYAGR